MKISAFLILGLLFFAVHTSQAQSPVVFKYKIDPGYSPNNYKHPNKAALAAKYTVDRLTTFDYIKPAPVIGIRQWNYKNQDFAPKTTIGMGGAIIPVPAQKKTKNPADSPANYKRQFR